MKTSGKLFYTAAGSIALLFAAGCNSLSTSGGKSPSSPAAAKISDHNSKREIEQTPGMIGRLGISQKELKVNDVSLLYCEKVVCPELPGKPVLVMFLHGSGSRGSDNFLQIRTPAEPLIRFFESRKRKAVLLFPQCRKGFRWTMLRGSKKPEYGILPAEPLPYMKAVLELLDRKTAEFQPEIRAALGLSMGGHGVWDMVCRRNFELIGVMCGRGDTKYAHRFAKAKICIYHGDKDHIVSVRYGREMADALKKAGCKNLFYKELPGVRHNAWDPFFLDGDALSYLFDK